MLEDRRRSEQIAIEQDALLLVDSIAHRAPLIDVSLHGLSVRTTFPLRPGQVVEFKTNGDSNFLVRYRTGSVGET
jgi:hypothetical protein